MSGGYEDKETATTRWLVKVEEAGNTQLSIDFDAFLERGRRTQINRELAY